MTWTSVLRFHARIRRSPFPQSTSGEALASVELDDEQMQALEASLTAELRVKFQVHGMHGRLNKIAPIIADGKAKKLATANWKTVQPVTME